MKNHVVSLELAKEMKELGFPQNSAFHWYENAGNGHLLYAGEDRDCRPMECKTFDAYLASELGEWLPDCADIIKFIRTDSVLYEIEILDPQSRSSERFDDISMPNALAKMLIYLAKEKLIDPKKL